MSQPDDPFATCVYCGITGQPMRPTPAIDELDTGLECIDIEACRARIDAGRGLDDARAQASPAKQAPRPRRRPSTRSTPTRAARPPATPPKRTSNRTVAIWLVVSAALLFGACEYWTINSQPPATAQEQALARAQAACGGNPYSGGGNPQSQGCRDAMATMAALPNHGYVVPTPQH